MRGSTRTSTVRAAGTMSTTPGGRDALERRVQREHVVERRRPRAGSRGPPSAARGRSPRRAHLDAGVVEGRAHGAGHRDRRRRVAVDAERCRVRRDRGAVGRRDDALAHEAHRACGDGVRGRRAARPARRAARASRRPGSRGRGTPRARTAAPRPPRRAAISPPSPRTGRGRPSAVRERGDRVGDGVGLRRDPSIDRVVERAVRLDVAEVGARLDERGELGGRSSARSSAGSRSQSRAAEVRGIRIGRMRADRDAEPGGPGDRVAHGRGIPRMPAAGDARARDDREHRLVVGRRHAVDGLAEVGVEVDRSPCCPR